MKLVIQIPCYNEAQTLETALNHLPGKIEGIDSIEYLIINDGSSDETVTVAKEWGVHHVVSFKQNRGLAKAMLRFGMEELKRRGFCGVRFMVNKTNAKAIRSYASFGFHVAGKCHIYEQDMFCYEKKL